MRKLRPLPPPPPTTNKEILQLRKDEQHHSYEQVLWDRAALLGSLLGLNHSNVVETVHRFGMPATLDALKKLLDQRTPS